MNNEQKRDILTAYCAAMPTLDKTLFQQLVAATPAAQIVSWQRTISELDAPKLQRALRRGRTNMGQGEFAWDTLQLSQEGASWQGEVIGEIVHCYKTRQATEAQARIAYDIMYSRYRSFVAREHKVLTLDESDFHLVLFRPKTAPTIPDLWHKFATWLFSERNLQEGFAALVNVIRLADRGFSALDVPIVTQKQAHYLAAFNLTNLNSLRWGDQRRRNEIAKLENDLFEAEEKEVPRIEKKIAGLHKEIATREERYGEMYAAVDAFAEQYPAMKQVERLAWSHKRKGGGAFNALAGVQIAKSGAKMGKAVRQIEDLVTAEQFFELPMLVSADPPITDSREAGDSSTKFCYGCGHSIARKEPSYKANKFIFESPSQRPQSGASQKEPTICATCAALAFISPIKLGGDRLVVRLEHRAEGVGNLVGDQLRMFTMNALNVVAGKYVILRVTETISNDPIIDKLGGLQYALFKIAASFEAAVFKSFRVFAVIGGMEQELNTRHLIVLHKLAKLFGVDRKVPQNKSKFSAFGRSVRHIQRENVIEAIYELLSAEMTYLPLGIAQRVQLEEIRETHFKELAMDKEEKDKESNVITLNADVAAVNGLLYAFLKRAHDKLKKRETEKQQRIEMRKIIERSKDADNLIYTISPYVARKDGSVTCYLSRDADTYFSYDMLLELLASLEHKPAERESSRENSIALTLDDIRNVYAYLRGKRYSQPQQWRQFTYKLNLSLASRFPQYYAKKENEQE